MPTLLSFSNDAPESIGLHSGGMAQNSEILLQLPTLHLLRSDPGVAGYRLNVKRYCDRNSTAGYTRLVCSARVQHRSRLNTSSGETVKLFVKLPAFGADTPRRTLKAGRNDRTAGIKFSLPLNKRGA